MKNLQDARIDNVLFWINPVEKSAVLCQQRKSDVLTSFGLAACSAIYYKAGSPLPFCLFSQQFLGKVLRISGKAHD
jgi:hypothetical protein